MLRFLVALDARHRSRRALAALPAERLDDVGLTPADVEAELARPIWDGPSAAWRGGLRALSAGRSVSGRVRLSSP